MDLSSQMGKESVYSLTLPRNRFFTGLYENFNFSSPTFSFIITITTIESLWANLNKLAQASPLSPSGAQSSY